MIFSEAVNKNGIVLDCDITGSRWGTYKVLFRNSKTKEDDFVTFDVISPMTNSGNDKCEALYKAFCKDEGLLQNTVTEVHIIYASELMTGYGKK